MVGSIEAANHLQQFDNSVTTAKLEIGRLGDESACNWEYFLKKEWRYATDF